MHKNDIKARRIYATCHGVGDPLKACPSSNVIPPLPRPSLPFSVKRYRHKYGTKKLDALGPHRIWMGGVVDPLKHVLSRWGYPMANLIALGQTVRTYPPENGPLVSNVLPFKVTQDHWN